jgi:uncharacterized protein YegL
MELKEVNVMETRIKCLPVYILVDTSHSMSQYEDVLNAMIESLYDELIISPRISDFAHVSVISYNSQAEVVLEMTDLQVLDQLPQLGCGGYTNFAAAIRLLRQRIEEDVPRLNDSGRAVLRPVAFLLTDGQPTDERGQLSDAWKPEFAALVESSYRRHPHVVPFGYGGATAAVVTELATIPGAAYLANDTKTADALKKIMAALLNTLVASARDNALRLPTQVEGFIQVSRDVVE